MIGKTVSHYKIIEELGRGGMGTVYKAEDTKLDRFVALKFLPPHLSQAEEEKKRFIHEAKAASALDHPHICTIHEINETEPAPGELGEGQIFIAMACYEGKSLKDKIKDQSLSGSEMKTGLRIKEALDYAIQIAQGLAKAHEKGIIHRDIKPANIFITTDGIVKILDFGLAKLAGQTRLTKTGSTLGTVAYMSPEQTRGSEVDVRTDIWALGVILYEMLTGKQPFSGDYEQAVIYSIIKEDPKPLSELSSDIPGALEQIVNRALEKDADKRYQHITELLEDLESFSAGIVPEAIQARMRKVRLRKRKRAILYAVGVVVIIAVVTALILYIRQSEAIDSIAVLPLKNLTGNAEQEYFVDGVTDELIGELGQISGLKRVISRTSVMQYKNTNMSLSEIARELNVDAVLEGTMYEAGDSVRIRFQLIDVLPEEQNLWGNTYKRAKTDILVMYSEITQTVADIVQVCLTPEEETRLAGVRQVNPEAYEAYLKGQGHLAKMTPPDLETALQYFEMALEKDPDFALAHVGIGLVWVFRNQMGMVLPSEALPRSKTAVQEALKLDDSIAEAHYALALIRTWGDWDWKGAEEAFLRALELNPNFPDSRIFYSHYLVIMNRPEEAMVQMKRTLELDPFNALFRSLAGAVLLMTGRYDDAIEQCQNALRTVPNHWLGLSILQNAYHIKGMHDESMETLKDFYTMLGFEEAIQLLTGVYEDAGYTAAMNSLAKMFEEISQTAYFPPNMIADTHVMAGNKNKAMYWLEKTFEMHDPNIPYIGVFPYYVNLLNDEPRYQELLRKMNLPLGDIN
jgi:TolB-like protein/Tfp pilus assembly protein PilF